MHDTRGVPETVLLLDDDAQFRANVTPALEACGLRVLHATKGSIALALIEEEEPGVLVVDGLLPDTNGIAWLEELRRAGYRTPVIFVSAFYRDLATFKHLTDDLDVLKVFHKPVVTERFAREVASSVVRRTTSTPAPPQHVEDTTEAVLYPEDPTERPRLESGQSYSSLLPVAADNLTGAIQRLRVESERASVLADALRQAHDLRGAAEMHGYAEISSAAARIESQLRRLQSSGRLDWPAIFDSIDEVRVQAAVAVGQSVESLRPAAAAPPSVTPAASSLLHRTVPRAFVPTVLVLEDDPAMIAYLRSAFDEVLVDLLPVATVDEALKTAGRTPPTAALVGWPLEDRDALRRFSRVFRTVPGCSECPVILLSVEDDPHTRALAAQLGVDIFLPHPIELVRLHHAVHTAVERATMPRPKVAVLRDAEAAQDVGEIGMDCSLYFSLEELLRDVEVQCPDVVLIGSTVTGAQVPAIIQMSTWDSDCTFLCFEDSPLVDSPVIAHRLGRDEGWLVELHREAERIARLRRQQLRCSQTGLAFRGASTSNLESGLSAAQRHGRTYSIGLISAVGLDGLDRVRARRLRTHLGRLISRRFRREDARGRWDDDTFVVGVEGSSARAVAEVFRRLLEEITAQRDREPDELGFLHIAVGLASYPLDGDTSRSLILVAHERLETATERGPGSLVWR